MARQTFEFNCSSCSKYFDFRINTSLSGNFRVHCPNCGHVHYRTLEKGKITENRFPQNDSQLLIEDIVPMKSSCRDFSKEKIKDVSMKPEGFMHRLWREKFAT